MLLQPFERLGNMECFYCRAPIQVYEFESTVINYSKEGIPRSSTNINHRLDGRCPNCGVLYEVGRIGLISYIESVRDNPNMKGVESYGTLSIKEDEPHTSTNEFCDVP